MNLTQFLTLENLIPTINATPHLQYSTNILGLSTDTRTIQSNNIFLALNGENYKGVEFLEKAVCQGAAAILANESDILPQHIELCQKHSCSLLSVIDTTSAYGEMAKNWLKLFPGVKIAITGSSGKTTCREILKEILKKGHTVYSNLKNNNNHIGVPQSILALQTPYDYYIFEIGMNHTGELDYLSKLISPDHTIISNIGTAHIGNFANHSQLVLAKLEILNHQQRGGFCSLPSKMKNEPWFNLVEMAAKKNKINLLFADPSGYQLLPPEGETSYILTPTQNKISTQLFGVHNIENFATCKELAVTLGISIKSAESALESVQVERFEQVSVTPLVINDAYNANPDSMKRGIETFLTSFQKENRVLVLGDMLELGQWSTSLHCEIANFIIEIGDRLLHPTDTIVAVGPYMQHFYNALHDNQFHVSNLVYYNNIESAAAYLKSFEKKYAFYFKASNGTNFKKLIEDFLCSITSSSH